MANLLLLSNFKPECCTEPMILFNVSQFQLELQINSYRGKVAIKTATLSQEEKNKFKLYSKTDIY
jgi:hypothetical protein